MDISDLNQFEIRFSISKYDNEFSNSVKWDVNVSYSTRQRAVILDILRQSGSAADGTGNSRAGESRQCEVGIGDGVSRPEDLYGSRRDHPGRDSRRASPCYEPTDRGHHHHFICQHCRRVFDLPGCVGGLEGWLLRISGLNGTKLCLYGACASCAGLDPAVDLDHQ